MTIALVAVDRPAQLRAARELLCQAAYRLEVNPSTTIDEVILEMLASLADRAKVRIFDPSLLSRISSAWSSEKACADKMLAEISREELSAYQPLERAVMKLGTIELLSRRDTKSGVIINEWIEIAKAYGSEGSHTLINALLEQVRSKLRD